MTTKDDRTMEKMRDALLRRKVDIVHLTHNDLDAAGCDAVHRLKYGKVFTIWSSVGKFPRFLKLIAESDGKGQTLSISDLGYCKGAEEMLKSAKKRGWRIEWRDHHRWTKSEQEAASSLTDLLIIDTDTCATGIAAKTLLSEDEWGKDIARIVCDYDLWRHTDPLSAVLGETCTRQKNLGMVRDCFVSGHLTNPEIEREYKTIKEEREEATEKSIRHTVLIKGKYTIAFAPLYGYPSETAHTIRDKMGTDIEVIVSDKGRFSIRSVPPVSHLIAREFGGGGHPPAAGGSFQFSALDRLYFLVLKRSRYYKKLAEVSKKY